MPTQQARRLQLKDDARLVNEGDFPQDIVESLKGSHKFVSLIGSGAMGSVYKIRNILLDRDEALKIISGDLSLDRLKRLREEAKALSRVNNAGIATIYGVAISASSKPFILMEYLDGVPLSKIIKEQSPLNPDWVVVIFYIICVAIEAAHRRGIIHRDIKPDNIIICTEDFGFDLAKVIDFGIARITETDRQVLTAAGTSLGTPLYMAPECFIDGQEITYKADIYSLGCLIYEMLTGKAPFAAPTYLELAKKHISEEPPALPPSLRYFQPLLRKAMAKNPDERYETCTVMWEAFFNALWSFWRRPPLLIPKNRNDFFVKSRTPVEGIERHATIFWCLCGLMAVLVIVAILLPADQKLIPAIAALACLFASGLHIARVRRIYPLINWWKEKAEGYRI